MQQALDGTLWFADRYGRISTLSPDGAWTMVIEFDATINAMVLQEETLWIGTDRGLIRLKDGETQTYLQEDGLTDSNILCLALDPIKPANLWVGTANESLCWIRPPAPRAAFLNLSMVHSAPGYIPVF